MGAVVVLAAGCGGSIAQGSDGASAPGVHWEPAVLRADGGHLVLLDVRVEGPSTVCDVALSRQEEGALPQWQSLALEGGRATRGARLSESEVEPGPLRLRVQLCDGREVSTDVRHATPGESLAATIDI